MEPTTNANGDSSEIVYLDANNLYGLAQMAKLPQSDFTWLSPEEIKKFDVTKLDLEGDYGYFVDCDLHYSKTLHNKHSNLPLAPEVLEVNYDDLSPYSKNALFISGQKKRYKDVKLMATFTDRIHYGLHAKNLKLYLQLGMKLKKIHRILRFKQSAFIAPFIQKCTDARQASKTKFESDQFKKLSNTVYGKTMQNVRDYINVGLHTNIRSALRAVSNPTFKNFVILNENLVQTNHTVPIIKHNQPIAIGVAILELVRPF